MFRLFSKILLVAGVVFPGVTAAPFFAPENSPVHLQWDYPHGAVVTGFRLYDNGVLTKPYDMGAYITVVTVNNVDTFQLDTSSLPAGVHLFTLTAYDAVQESVPSNVCEIDVLPKPSAPQNLRKF